MTFDKAAQRARAQQIDAAAGLPAVKPVEKTIKVFDKQVARIGDTVVYVKVYSGSATLQKRKVTDIRDGRVFMDGSSQGAKPHNLVLYNV